MRLKRYVTIVDKVNLMNIRTYSELITLPTFEERFRYLKLNGTVGGKTFGHERYLNQKFYTSQEWRSLRRQIIIRDNGCDLGVEGLDIRGPIFIHHINPILAEDIIHCSEYLMNPEYLICVSKQTHNAIHYGDINLSNTTFVERTKNDTCPWKRD